MAYELFFGRLCLFLNPLRHNLTLENIVYEKNARHVKLFNNPLIVFFFFHNYNIFLKITSNKCIIALPVIAQQGLHSIVRTKVFT